MLLSDYHIHTYYSPCGHRLDDSSQPLASPERHLGRARELGLSEIVFSDHFVEDPTAPGVALYYKGSGPAIIANLKDELSRWPANDGLDVYVGCETETLSTEWVGVGPELASQLDFVLAPTTHYHLPGVPQPSSWAPAVVADHMLTMLASVARKPWIDAVAHPFSEDEALIGDLRAIYEAMEISRLSDILGLMSCNRIALEVNGACFASAKLPHYAEVYAHIVSLAKSLGVRFSFGSDAHDFRKIGLSPEVEAWIVAAGLEAADFVTLADIRARRAALQGAAEPSCVRREKTTARGSRR